MRFGFFRDRLCIEPTFTGTFNPSSVFKLAEKSSNLPALGSESTEPPKFNAAELQEKLKITEAAAKLLTDGGKLRLTEKEVLEKLNKAYDVSRKSDSEPDGFKAFNNPELINRVNDLDGQPNISIKDGNLAWGAAGAVKPESKPSEQLTPKPGLTINSTKSQTASTTERREAGFAGPEFNPPSEEILKADIGKIQSALEKTGGDKNQKIEYQGVLLTDNSDMGSSNVRLYSVGEPDNAKYAGIKQGDEILSQKELKAHLEELNKTRTAENQLNTGIIGDILNKPEQYLNVPEKTEA
jgi:hypothetical protein